MSVVGISCAYVDDVQRNIGNARRAINDVKTNLSNARRELSPHSSNSRISADYSTINKNINRLNSDLDVLNSFERKFNTFVREVQEADSRCAKSIKANSQTYNSANGIPNRPVMAAIAGLLNKSLKIVKKILNVVLNPISLAFFVGSIVKDSIKDFYSKNIKPWLNRGKEIFNSFKQWIKDGYNFIKVKIKEVVKSAINIIIDTGIIIGNAIKCVVSTTKNVLDFIHDTRRAIVKSLINGILGVGKFIWDNKWAILKVVTGAIAVVGAGGLTLITGGTVGITALPVIALGVNDVISGIVDIFDTKNKDGSKDLLHNVVIDTTNSAIDLVERHTGRDIPDNQEQMIVGASSLLYNLGSFFISVGGVDQIGYSGKLADDVWLGIGLKSEEFSDAIGTAGNIKNTIKNNGISGIREISDSIIDTASIKSSWNFLKQDIRISGIKNKFNAIAYNGANICSDISGSLPFKLYDGIISIKNSASFHIESLKNMKTVASM